MKVEPHCGQEGISRSEVTELVAFGDEAGHVEDDKSTRGGWWIWMGWRSWRVMRGPGKADYVKKSGEKGLMYLWSRTPPY